MIKFLRILFQMFFRLFFTVEYYGVENIPSTGAAVLAGNHPSYLDPLLIYIAAKRPIRFLAWDKIFTIPLLGWIVKSVGAIPVNLSKKDSNAFQQAMSVLAHGDLIALFPEGQRSQQGTMEQLKSGAARMAVFNKCPLVPITITGAYEAWPVTRLLPRLRKITVKFHEPIMPAEDWTARGEDPQLWNEITESWRNTVNQRLLPGLHAQELINKHFARPAAHLRIYEMVPVGVFLIMLVTATVVPISMLQLVLPFLVYYGYMGLDIGVLRQGRTTKIVRDLATPLLMLAWHPLLVKAINVPGIEFLSLMIVMAGIFLPYYWTNYYDTQRFLRGLVMSYYLGFTLEIFKPAAFGLHWTLAAFALIYALYHRPLFWYCHIFVISLYGLALYLLLGEFALVSLGYYLLVALVVNIYMLAFKFTAHDGRVV